MQNWLYIRLYLLLGLLITFLNINFSLCEDEIYNIKDFRSNPMGIAQKEDLFKVNLGLPLNSRILSYVDFNSDK